MPKVHFCSMSIKPVGTNPAYLHKLIRTSKLAAFLVAQNKNPRLAKLGGAGDGDPHHDILWLVFHKISHSAPCHHFSPQRVGKLLLVPLICGALAQIRG